MATNPYNQKTQEAKYLSWEHGYNALNEHENPYEQDVDPEYYHSWTQGFKANKTRPKSEARPALRVTAQPVDNVQDLPVSAVLGPVSLADLSSIPTDVLLNEVAIRIKKFENTVAEMKKVLS